MKLEKATFGKRTVTLHTSEHWAGESARVTTLAYRSIASSELSTLDGELYLTVSANGLFLTLDGKEAGDEPRLRELAADLHRHMEQCE